MGRVLQVALTARDCSLGLVFDSAIGLQMAFVALRCIVDMYLKYFTSGHHCVERSCSQDQRTFKIALSKATVPRVELIEVEMCFHYICVVRLRYVDRALHVCRTRKQRGFRVSVGEQLPKVFQDF